MFSWESAAVILSLHAITANAHNILVALLRQTYASVSTDYTVTETYSQLADFLFTHVDGIKQFSHHRCH
eukprot:jgi/Chrzof1/892/Cz01g32270.t1